jgi:hypothetical protein
MNQDKSSPLHSQYQLEIGTRDLVDSIICRCRKHQQKDSKFIVEKGILKYITNI